MIFHLHAFVFLNLLRTGTSIQQAGKNYFPNFTPYFLIFPGTLLIFWPSMWASEVLTTPMCTFVSFLNCNYVVACTLYLTVSWWLQLELIKRNETCLFLGCYSAHCQVCSTFIKFISIRFQVSCQAATSK